MKRPPADYRLLRSYLYLLATFTLFWWPLSHWLYPEWYHTLLGFEQYDEALVRIIGTIGFPPVALLYLSAGKPLQHRDSVITLLLFFPLLAATYLYLIAQYAFPTAELINVALLLINTALLAWLYPWRHAALWASQCREASSSKTKPAPA